jgi:hypothetical protein
MWWPRGVAFEPFQHPLPVGRVSVVSFGAHTIGDSAPQRAGAGAGGGRPDRRRRFRSPRSGYDSPAAEGRPAGARCSRESLPELRHVMYMYQNYGELKHDNPMVFLSVSNSRN